MRKDPVSVVRVVGGVMAGVLAAAPLAGQTLAQFESPQTSALALADEGRRLLVVDTPAHRLCVFSLATPARPVLLAEIPVALEPIAVAAAGADEAWVACHLADAVCVVDLAQRVVRATLWVGDEPGDVVVANGRAFVSVANRRELVVFDVATRTEIARIALPADEPRWLVRDAAGGTVFVAAHKSGNETTVVAGPSAPMPPPPWNPQLPPAPRTARIVHSEDPTFSSLHGVDLPDHDVFAVDTTSLAVVRTTSGVGTLLFGLDVHPVDGSLWVANTESRNLQRFEPVLRGHVVDNRLTRIAAGPGGAATAFDLQPGVDYTMLPNPGARAIALAQPTDVVFRPDGGEIYVAAFGSDRIGVVDPSSGAVLARIPIGDATSSREKRGPRALAIGGDGRWLYVCNRLANSLAVVDTVARSQVAEFTLGHDPTPAAVKAGRGFLYDAKLSGNGTASCASCHVDGGTDQLAWDLGDPAGSLATVPGVFGNEVVHPMKGPMTTQTLVGLQGLQLLHWRGDRLGLSSFDATFATLLGGAPLPTADFAAFAEFLQALAPSPNPHQLPDRTWSASPAGESAAEGRVLFEQTPTFTNGMRCGDCHTLASGGPSSGAVLCAATLGETQPFRIAPLHSVHERVAVPVPGGRSSGFGLVHDGRFGDVFEMFGQPAPMLLPLTPAQRRQLAAYVLAFDSGTAPVVGRAMTVDALNHAAPAVAAEIGLLVAQCAAGACGIAVVGNLDNRPAGFAYEAATGLFLPHRASVPPVGANDLLQFAASGRASWTFLAVPPGEAWRLGVDRDGDLVRDGDEAPTAYGTTTSGCPLTLRAACAPFVGNDQFAVVVDGAVAAAPGLWLVGIAQQTAVVFGLDLWVDPTAAAMVPFVGDARGVAALAIPVPAVSALRGSTLFVQAFVADVCGVGGLAATHGLRAVVD